MTASNLITMIGWTFLISSWIVPFVMKKRNVDSMDRRMIGLLLSAIALLIFVLHMVFEWMK